MTSSGSYDFSYNRNQIIKAALRTIGAIQYNETPSNAIIVDASDALNIMVKEWEADGIHVWTESEAILFLQPNQIQYSLGPSSTDNAALYTGPNSASFTSFNSTTLSVAAAASAGTITVTSYSNMINGDYIGIVLDSGSIFWTTINGVPGSTTITLTSVMSGAAASGNAVYNYTQKIVRPLRVPFARRYNFSSAIDTPVITMSRRDYRELPNKTNTGVVNQYFYDPQLTGGFGFIYVWPAPPDATNCLKFTWYRPIQDFDTSGNTPDLPTEWISTLIYGLAVELAPQFAVPDDVFNRVVSMFAAKMEKLKGWDRETEPTFFGIDFSQQGYIR